MDADRRLRQIKSLGRPTHVVLLKQYIERAQKVQVETTQIIHGNTRYLRNSFSIYLITFYAACFTINEMNGESPYDCLA
ncbi:hypothetical protein GCM10010985_61440 [Caballeronia grimmiae]|uniref:Uncharacterized protein n=1 Tax=Caballeronia grimmiae TaxID=1071679 RepID=A0ABQ1S8P9_9BURK|nr:hypothetical protein GCM10010985_61440 [Caballeronia grimmiae]